MFLTVFELSPSLSCRAPNLRKGVWQQQLGGVTTVKRGVGLVGPYKNGKRPPMRARIFFEAKDLCMILFHMYVLVFRMYIMLIGSIIPTKSLIIITTANSYDTTRA